MIANYTLRAPHFAKNQLNFKVVIIVYPNQAKAQVLIFIAVQDLMEAIHTYILIYLKYMSLKAVKVILKVVGLLSSMLERV